MNLPPDTPLDTRRLGWHRGSPWDRLRDLALSLGESSEELEAVLAQGGLSVEQADRLAENVVGTFSLPFAVAPNFRINGRDLLMPMVTDEPSVVAAASHAARMVREGGGFLADADPPITICQVSGPPGGRSCISSWPAARRAHSSSGWRSNTGFTRPAIAAIPSPRTASCAASARACAITWGLRRFPWWAVASGGKLRRRSMSRRPIASAAWPAP